MREKIRVGLVFGGRSGEHEVSLMSAQGIMAALDREKYEVVPIGITKEGRWLNDICQGFLLIKLAITSAGLPNCRYFTFFMYFALPSRAFLGSRGDVVSMSDSLPFKNSSSSSSWNIILFTISSFITF